MAYFTNPLRFLQSFQHFLTKALFIIRELSYQLDSLALIAPCSDFEKGYLGANTNNQCGWRHTRFFPAPPEIRCYLFLSSLLLFSLPALLVTSAMFRGHAWITASAVLQNLGGPSEHDFEAQ